jgi:RNA polymerase sigma-70 factor (ECF subfamily)
MGNSEGDNRKLMVGLLTQHQQRIFAYIHVLVPDPHSAWDILQQTCLVICEKFDEFDPQTDFVAWARQIAWWEVRAARQKFARGRLQVLDDEVLKLLAQSEEAGDEAANARRDALSNCLQRLQPRDREMILARYEAGNGVQQVAERCGRSLVAAYKSLSRIRRLLLDCITHRMAEEEA